MLWIFAVEMYLTWPYWYIGDINTLSPFTKWPFYKDPWLQKSKPFVCINCGSSVRNTTMGSLKGSLKTHKYSAHMLDLCRPLAEGSHLFPSLGLTFSRFRVVSLQEEVGVICWSCWCSSSGRRSPYNQDVTVKVGGSGERVLRKYRWRTTTDLITWHWGNNCISLYQYHKWAVCILNNDLKQ